MPELPYAPEALAPKMSKETFDYHYGKHLQTYVNNLNNLIAGTPYEEMPLDEIVRKADGGIFNNAAQAWNHTFFFRMLTPAQQPMPAKLAAKLTEAFGSVEAFKEQFTKAAVGLFGSGWAWLAMDKAGKLSIVAKPNAGNPMTDGLRPVMTVDVWEHAYYIDYRNRRPDFLAAFWELIDWQKVADRCIPKRYKCTACDYVYDPARAIPRRASSRGRRSRRFPTTGPARSADSTRPTSRLSRSKRKTSALSSGGFFVPGSRERIRRRTFRFSVRPAVPDAARGS